MSVLPSVGSYALGENGAVCFAMRSRAEALASNSGNLPCQRSCTAFIGDTESLGLAICPRNRVRTAWNGVGHCYRTSNSRSCLSDGPEVLAFLLTVRLSYAEVGLQT
jgi:hypothetical protein